LPRDRPVRSARGPTGSAGERMTTRPHTDERPAVDAGDDDGLWVQVACSR
jgi:hypothetical protein